MKKNLLFMFLVVMSVVAFGQKLPFQGKLIELGTPVSGTHSFVFEIASVGWAETHADVQVTDGLYFVVLGSSNPLPDSLFCGVSEQSLDISVDGTALSPVVIFKPLVSPYEGSELNVKNSEGTVVGTLKARNDSVNKNGEILVYGTNGFLNISADAGNNGNNGRFQLHDENGAGKANMFIYGGAGIFTALGKTTGALQGGFKAWESEESANRPFLSFEGNDIENKSLAWITVNKNDSTEFGAIDLISNNGKQVQINPDSINILSTTGNNAYLKPDGIFVNSGGSVKAGTYLTNNSGAFTLKGKTGGAINGLFQWWNPATANLPALYFDGNSGNNLYLNVNANNGKESGQIGISSTADESMVLAPYAIWLKRSNSGSNPGTYAQITTENWGGFGTAGFIGISGPTTNNISMGANNENRELPWMTLTGTENQDVIQMTAENDENESGNINILSKNGNNAYLSANELSFNSPNGDTYMISANGISTQNNGNQFYELTSQDWGGQGPSGLLKINGTTTQNFEITSKSWENPNLPWFKMSGETNGDAIQMSVENDENESGSINILSKNGNNAYLNANQLGLNYAWMNTQTNNQGTFGGLYLAGPNSHNFQFMPEWWDQPDLPRLLLLGTSQIAAIDMGAFPENGIEKAVINLYSTDESSSNWSPKRLSMSGTGERILSIIENDDRGVEVGRSYTYSADEKLSRIEPTNITLFDATGGNWNSLVSMGMNNDNGSWVGTLDINGPTSSNVHIGSQGNPDLPWITLQGTEGFETMQIGCVDDPSERGFIKMVDKSNGNEMFYSSDGVGGNVTFTIQNDVNVLGSVTATEHITTSSDKRFKKNIQKVENSLQKIELIDGVSYNWRQDEFPDKNFSSYKQIGVIAQDLEAQFPALVKTDKQGYKSVNYNGFTAVLLEAVKELNAKVEKLEAENTQLKAELTATTSNTTEIEQLKAQMDELAKMVQGKSSVTTAEEIISTPGLK